MVYDAGLALVGVWSLGCCTGGLQVIGSDQVEGFMNVYGCQVAHANISGSMFFILPTDNIHCNFET